MVYSFIFVGERNRGKILEEIASKISLSTSSYQVLFLNNKNFKNEDLSHHSHINFRKIVFRESATSDEMFETLLQSENLGTVVLFKESATNINFSDVKRMIEQNRNGHKIVVSKQNKHENIFMRALAQVKKFLIRIFLGMKLYPGEADIILIDQILVATMSEMNGKSGLLTKVNGWAGIDPKTVTIDEQKKVEKHFSIKNFLFPIIYEWLFILMLIGNVLFSVLNVKLPFLGLFSYILAEIALFGMFIYTLSKAMFRQEFGNISYTLTNEVVSEIDNFEE